MTPGQKIRMWNACIAWNMDQMKFAPENTARYRKNINILTARISAEEAKSWDPS